MNFNSFRSVIVVAVFALSISTVNADDGLFNTELNKFYGDFWENSQAHLLHVTSDAMSGFSDIQLALDSQSDMVALQQVTEKGEVRTFSPNQLASGAVLLRQDNRDIVKLVTRNFDTHSGGEVDLIYLSNGIFNSYETFTMELLRAGSEWKLYINSQGGRVSIGSMFLKGKFLFGKAIGIESVSVK